MSTPPCPSPTPSLSTQLRVPGRPIAAAGRRRLPSVLAFLIAASALLAVGCSDGSSEAEEESSESVPVADATSRADGTGGGPELDGAGGLGQETWTKPETSSGSDPDVVPTPEPDAPDLDAPEPDAPGGGPEGGDGVLEPDPGPLCDPSWIEASDPIAWWRFGEPPGATLALDHSGLGHHLELGPDAQPGAPGVSKDGDGSLHLPGLTLDSYAMLDPFDAFAGPEVTMATWIRLDEVEGFETLFEGVFDYNRTTEPATPNVFRVGINDTELSFKSVGSNGSLSGLEPTLEAWHHIAVTWHAETGEVHFHLDGASSSTDLEPFPLEPGGWLVLGNEMDTPLPGLNLSSTFLGRLDEMVVYDRILGPEELGELRASALCEVEEVPDPCGDLDAPCPYGFGCSPEGHCVGLDGEEVYVPGGRLFMGCNGALDPTCADHPEEAPQHAVDVPAFAIGRTEVTTDRYGTCLTLGGCTEPETIFCPATWPDESGHPVNCITATQAEDYCAHAGGRLCTEAEWELAARGACHLHCPTGDDACCAAAMPTYPWGEEAPSCDLAASASCSAEPPEVGSAPGGASPYGAWDLAGSSAEWVADCWHDSYDGAPIDGSAWTEACTDAAARATRGGGMAHELRSTSRAPLPADAAQAGRSFRCCRSL